ncbi:hypothetical protein O3P69_002648 [Scylla paramamosain]|uniref:Uncharacterized protein n=1 Tax=Scylla paramamosain TaxID=85552 RepID=A0AAW0UPU3_SCYPA
MAGELQVDRERQMAGEWQLTGELSSDVLDTWLTEFARTVASCQALFFASTVIFPSCFPIITAACLSTSLTKTNVSVSVKRGLLFLVGGSLAIANAVRTGDCGSFQNIIGDTVGLTQASAGSSSVCALC